MQTGAPLLEVSKLLGHSTIEMTKHYAHLALVQRNGGTTLSVEVGHRPRARGQSNYGLFDRLWVGIVDLLGVMWLKRRTRRPEAHEIHRPESRW